MRVEHAPAKLTLSLRVTGRRDDGYHLLDAEMVTLVVADTLLFGPGDGVELVPLVASPRFEPTLVTRALEAVGRREASVALDEARAALGRIGITAAGWDTAFRAAAGDAPLIESVPTARQP